MYDGHDLLKFNSYGEAPIDGEGPRYGLDPSKIVTFEDAIIILATVFEAINYSGIQLDAANMRIENHGDEDMTEKKEPGVVGEERSLDTYPIDSSQINTIEDVRLVIDAMELSFAHGYSSYDKLEKYLSKVPLGYKTH